VLYAALNRRSSTVLHAFVFHGAWFVMRVSAEKSHQPFVPADGATVEEPPFQGRARSLHKLPGFQPLWSYFPSLISQSGIAFAFARQLSHSIASA
jgi:hypothetical protein